MKHITTSYGQTNAGIPVSQLITATEKLYKTSNDDINELIHENSNISKFSRADKGGRLNAIKNIQASIIKLLEAINNFLKLSFEKMPSFVGECIDQKKINSLKRKLNLHTFQEHLQTFNKGDIDSINLFHLYDVIDNSKKLFQEPIEKLAQANQILTGFF